MEHKFPCPITAEKDLSIYEDYLNSDDCKNTAETAICNTQNTKGYEMKIESSRGCQLMPTASQMPEKLSNSAFFPAYLRNHIGKLIKVESLIGNCLESRIGTLIQVGADYIVIKLYQSCSTMVCDGASIKYITIIHNNDLNNAVLF